MTSYSIHNQLSRRVVLFTGIVLFVFALLSDITVTRWLERQYDEALITKASLLVTLTKDTPDGVDFDFADEFMPEFERQHNPEYFQLWTHDKKVFERSHSLVNNDLIYLNQASPGQLIQDIMLPDGRRGRMIQIVFLPQIPEVEDRTPEKLARQTLMTLAIARERESLNQLMLLVHVTLILGLLIVLFIINILVTKSIRNGLKPLNNMRDQIVLLDAGNLTYRLSLVRVPSELEDVIKQFNKLLERLETSFAREQRFSSNVAHELRTPIAEIRNMAEVAMKWPDDANLAKEFFRDVHASSLQMQQLVTNLLLLARTENGLIELEPKELYLKKIIDDALQYVKTEANKKQLIIQVEIPQALKVMTSYAEFYLIISNLLSNAVSYSPLNDVIKITLQKKGQYISLYFSNHTDCLEQSDLTYIFDRLWRKSKSRTSSLHSGLGLALVKSHADLLNMNTSAMLMDDNTIVFELGNIPIIG